MKYSTRNILKIILWLIGLFVLSILYTQFPFYKLFPQYPILFWFWFYGGFLMLLVASTLLTHEKKWIRGQEGEDEVFNISRYLPKEFIPLSSLILNNRGNVDEVIVGPTGIWAIEVKSHRGNITFDGNELQRNGELFERDFLGQAWAERCSVRDTLKKELGKEFFVQPVIVFSDMYAEVHFGLNPIRGVYVIGADWLNKLIIESNKQSLNDSDIKDVVEVLKPYQE